MPVTPIFRLSQSDEEFIVSLSVLPSISLKDASIGVSEGCFIFNAKPYMLRMQLPGGVRDVDESLSVTIDKSNRADSAVGPSVPPVNEAFMQLRVVMKKSTPGQVFDGLHLPARFIVGKGSDGKNIHAQIEGRANANGSSAGVGESNDLVARLSGLVSADESLENEWREQKARLSIAPPRIEVVDAIDYDSGLEIGDADAKPSGLLGLGPGAPADAAITDETASSTAAHSLQCDSGKSAQANSDPKPSVTRSSALLSLEERLRSPAIQDQVAPGSTEVTSASKEAVTADPSETQIDLSQDATECRDSTSEIADTLAATRAAGASIEEAAAMAMSTTPYGFNRGHEGVLERLQPHELATAVLLDPLREPRRVSLQERRRAVDADTRRRTDAMRLVEDTASADEDMMFQSAVAAQCHWDTAFRQRKAWAKGRAVADKQKQKQKQTVEEKAKGKQPSGGESEPLDLQPVQRNTSDPGAGGITSSDQTAQLDVKPVYHALESQAGGVPTSATSTATGTAAATAAIDADAWFGGFTRAETDRLLSLPNRKEFNIGAGSQDEIVAVSDVASLLYTYCHEHRCTLGAEGEGKTELEAGEDDVSPESARTVVEMCPQLAGLVNADSLALGQWGCLRRALCVPYMRCWRLARLIVRDVSRVLACGRPAIVRCLLGLREMLRIDPVRSRHCGIWIDDAIVWVQRSSPGLWQRAATEYRGVSARATPEGIGMCVDMGMVEKAASLLISGGAADPFEAWVAVGGTQRGTAGGGYSEGASIEGHGGSSSSGIGKGTGRGAGGAGAAMPPEEMGGSRGIEIVGE